MHNDPLQGILFTHQQPALTSRPGSRKNVLARMLAAAGVWNRSGKSVTQVTVQYVASDQYIADPAALLERFRTLQLEDASAESETMLPSSRD